MRRSLFVGKATCACVRPGDKSLFSKVKEGKGKVGEVEKSRASSPPRRIVQPLRSSCCSRRQPRSSVTAAEGKEKELFSSPSSSFLCVSSFSFARTPSWICAQARRGAASLKSIVVLYRKKDMPPFPPPIQRSGRRKKIDTFWLRYFFLSGRPIHVGRRGRGGEYVGRAKDRRKHY